MYFTSIWNTAKYRYHDDASYMNYQKISFTRIKASNFENDIFANTILFISVCVCTCDWVLVKFSFTKSMLNFSIQFRLQRLKHFTVRQQPSDQIMHFIFVLMKSSYMLISSMRCAYIESIKLAISNQITKSQTSYFPIQFFTALWRICSIGDILLNVFTERRSKKKT